MKYRITAPARAATRAFLIGASLLALAACQPGWDNPYEREGTWIPQGDNMANLRAMAANPADLDVGQGTNTALGQTSAAAVRRLRTDKVKTLPEVGGIEFGGGVSGSASGGGDSAGAGASGTQ